MCPCVGASWPTLRNHSLLDSSCGWTGIDLSTFRLLRCHRSDKQKLCPWWHNVWINMCKHLEINQCWQDIVLQLNVKISLNEFTSWAICHPQQQDDPKKVNIDKYANSQSTDWKKVWPIRRKQCSALSSSVANQHAWYRSGGTPNLLWQLCVCGCETSEVGMRRPAIILKI